jgi:hypothetical protein
MENEAEVKSLVQSLRFSMKRKMRGKLRHVRKKRKGERI